MDRVFLKEIQSALIALLMCPRHEQEQWNKAVDQAGKVFERIAHELDYR